MFADRTGRWTAARGEEQEWDRALLQTKNYPGWQTQLGSATVELMASGLLRVQIDRTGNGRPSHARFRAYWTSAREIHWREICRIFDLVDSEEIAVEAFDPFNY